MAKVKAPLFGFGASGAIGGALVYGIWKGIDWVREYVIPANPKSTDQTTQRDAMGACVSAWKNYFLVAEARTAWDRMALRLNGALSGFNAFIKNTIQLIHTDPNASFVDSMTEQAGRLINFDLKNIDDGAQANEAGVFEMWAGPTVTGLIIQETIPLVAGEIIGTIVQGTVGQIRYCKIRKDGYDRSGIFKATLEA